MRVALFCHSLISDWNHGNAHFLRGVTNELIRRCHQVDVYEPSDAWSFSNLLNETSTGDRAGLREWYPLLKSHRYDLASVDLEKALRGVDLVLVHEWNDVKLINSIGQLRHRLPFIAIFHDTHHRVVSSPESVPFGALEEYDAVLTFGRALADAYRGNGFSKPVFVWHEAADTSIFRPYCRSEFLGDVVLIANWGDQERSAEFEEFFFRPVRKLGLKAALYGVRYPDEALRKIKDAGIDYNGWTPNYLVPNIFARFKLTVHIPRRWYVNPLPGIPTIRVFEALACGIPLISAPWKDSEWLFRPGDFLFARNGDDMARKMSEILAHPDAANARAAGGRETILARHTCAHRVSELLEMYSALRRSLRFGFT
jgi:spore maturation protein CgeB